MVTTLIIPDIHLEIEWAEEMLAQYEPQRVILLGDYFDLSPRARVQRLVEPLEEQSARIVRWLADQLGRFGEEMILLIGNHDAPYFYPDATIQIYAEPEPVFKTSYYRKSVQNAIEQLRDEMALVREKAVWFHYDEQNDFLFTHAGVSAETFADSTGDVTLEGISQLVSEGLAKAYEGAHHRAFGIGCARGGSQRVGGLTWLDFNAEFKPVAGWRQIVGHTAQLRGFNQQGDNYCLDGMQSTVGLVENGELQVLINGEKVN